MCIVGVGLIGGSIARASRKNNLCGEIVGVGRRESTLKKAVELGIIDDYELSLSKAVEGADLVVICSPVGSFELLFDELKSVWSDSCLYTDVGSTKESIVSDLQQVFGYLPSNFIPAHPIAGSENSGLEASKEDLFDGKRAIITPVVGGDLLMQRKCSQWWQSMGACVSEMTPAHHDEVFAASSHLPHVLAFSLVELLKNKENEREIFKYAAGGFKDFTRIASSDPEMWSDICLANGPQLVKILGELQQLNQKISGLIERKDKQGLLGIFTSAQTARNDYLSINKK